MEETTGAAQTEGSTREPDSEKLHPVTVLAVFIACVHVYTLDRGPWDFALFVVSAAALLGVIWLSDDIASCRVARAVAAAAGLGAGRGSTGPAPDRWDGPAITFPNTSTTARPQDPQESPGGEVVLGVPVSGQGRVPVGQAIPRARGYLFAGVSVSTPLHTVLGSAPIAPSPPSADSSSGPAP